MAEVKFRKDQVGVVEVIREYVFAGDSRESELRYTVLCSSWTKGRLTSQVGFSNDPIHCEEMTARGFAFIEARIAMKDRDGVVDRLTVQAPAFVGAAKPPYEIDYEDELLSIWPVVFETGSGALERNYEQAKFTPDLVSPADTLRALPIEWNLDRCNVATIANPCGMVTVPCDLRWPRTVAVGPHDLITVWSGEIRPAPQRSTSNRRVVVPPQRSKIWIRGASDTPRRIKRPKYLGSSASWFRNIEVLGARLEVPRFQSPAPANDVMAQKEQQTQEQKFYGLIEPLNFHLPKGAESDLPDFLRPDFHYRPATTAITIELLRYGRMGILEDMEGMTSEDFQSQHELMVRAVVGRIDQDAAQGQDPSTFVPAIFVDNTWSKFIGRHFNGLDKRLAHFCIDESGDEGRSGERSRQRGEARKVVPLSPADAADIRENAPPLHRIVQVRLASWMLPETAGSLDDPVDGAPLIEAPAATAAALVDKERERLAKLGPVLYELECDPEFIKGWDDFKAAPSDAILGTSPLAVRPWRQEDFEDPEVRRDFARAAGGGVADAFYGVQASPLIEIDDAPKPDINEDPECDPDAYVEKYREVFETRAWILGRYRIRGTSRMARPAGNISIRLYRIPPAEAQGRNEALVAGWDRLCDLLNITEPERAGEPPSKRFTFGPGSWYRLKYGMDLESVNGRDP